jgi:hypothetical protein
MISNILETDLRTRLQSYGNLPFQLEVIYTIPVPCVGQVQLLGEGGILLGVGADRRQAVLLLLVIY